jgi:hypothetical protein
VFGVQYPVAGSAQAQQEQAFQGTQNEQLAVADIQVCPTATPLSASDGFLPNNFDLLTSDQRTWQFWDIQIGALDPDIVQPMLGLHGPTTACVRGYLTFEVDPGEIVTGVTYEDPSGPPVTWATGS